MSSHRSRGSRVLPPGAQYFSRPCGRRVERRHMISINRFANAALFVAVSAAINVVTVSGALSIDILGSGCKKFLIGETTVNNVRGPLQLNDPIIRKAKDYAWADWEAKAAAAYGASCASRRNARQASFECDYNAYLNAARCKVTARACCYRIKLPATPPVPQPEPSLPPSMFKSPK